MKNLTVGLIRGRHEMPVDKYIFEEDIKDMFDYQAISNHISNFIMNEVGVDFYNGTFIRTNKGTKSLTVYVTGLTSVSCELVDLCNRYGVILTLMHYNRDTGVYHPQYLGRSVGFDFLKKGERK